ncbi:hypothetical protein [Methylobacterium sp. Gmos1]
MNIKYAIVFFSLSSCAAQAEEAWFQACGPVYPVRLEGPACTSREGEIGSRGTDPTGIDWCCVTQRLTDEERCAKKIKDFTEDSRRGRKPSETRFTLLQMECKNELADLSKRTGAKIPVFSQRRNLPQQGRNAEQDRQMPPGSRRSPVIDPYLNEILKFGIAIAAQAAIVYPVRPMKIDPGKSRTHSGDPSNPASRYPDILRDAQRRPSGISGLGGPGRNSSPVPVNHPSDPGANVPARSSMLPAASAKPGSASGQSSKAGGVIINPDPQKVQAAPFDIKEKILKLQSAN